ncbi:uncharacterized protein LOC135812900 [Sycon ciliatum]|uniref:uncharacterized protein LOC135812900 n=1 Tax=Sycon ciliatum TaxID=27933 RepID=UPI0031F68562
MPLTCSFANTFSAGFCLTGSDGSLLRNCQPEDGILKSSGESILILPENDLQSVSMSVGSSNFYKKTFTFTSPCDVVFKAISLGYFGSCSVSVHYGRDNRSLQTLQYPDLQTPSWHTGNGILTSASSRILREYMKENSTRRLLITVSPHIVGCQVIRVLQTHYQGLAIIAQDINECIDVTNICHKLPNPGSRKCVNTVGSYDCPCLDGYAGTTCRDIDECTSGTHNCSNVINYDNRQCLNVNGSYMCPCLPGYDGSECDDIDECTRGTHNCNTMINYENRQCLNQKGSFICPCLPGYAGSACDDIDECTRGTHSCNNMINYKNRQCLNLNGSYICSCLSGYAGSACDATYALTSSDCVSIVTFAISISLVVIVFVLIITVLLVQYRRVKLLLAQSTTRNDALQIMKDTAGSNTKPLTINDAYDTPQSAVQQDTAVYSTVQ